MARLAVLCLALAGMIVPAWGKGHSGCPECGGRRVKKVCRLVCETKKETEVKYGCESEDFCVPGPSRRCGVRCEKDECGHVHRDYVWQPSCAQIRTRKKLMKKEVTREVPSFKWVVEEVCRDCGHGCTH